VEVREKTLGDDESSLDLEEEGSNDLGRTSLLKRKKSKGTGRVGFQ